MANKPKKKAKNKRAKHYDKPLKIYGTFEQAIEAIVSEPKVEYKKTKPKK